MIVGNGLIAKLFQESDHDNVVFFASGVSNSLENRSSEFKREEKLLLEILQKSEEKVIVYFSTCSIYDSSKSESPYVSHKLHMEQIVTSHKGSYLILRVSNAVGKGGNPNLLMNYLTQTLIQRETISVHTKAKRNLINVEDIKNITLQLLNEKKYNHIINLAYIENFSTLEIINELESFYNLKADLILNPTGNGYDIDVPYVRSYFQKRNLTSKTEYLRKMLTDYYG